MPVDERTGLRIGLMLAMPGEDLRTAEIVARAQAAESEGFASGWLPQTLAFDALTVIALAGAATRSIELGTAVVPTYPRHPVALASQALTVEEATGHRLALGVGLSHRFLVEDMLGLDYSHPIQHAREYLTILGGLLRGDHVRFDGERYRVSAKVTVAGSQPPPLLVAALQPAMLRLCGRIADGTITLAAGLPYLRDTVVPTIRASAASAGRHPPRVLAMIPVAVTADPDHDRERIARRFRVYANVPSYRAILAHAGAGSLADTALCGDEQTVAAGLTDLEAAGVTDLIAMIGTDDSRTRTWLAERARAATCEA